MGVESKWKCKGFRKRDIFLTLHWAPELSTELLACVKHCIDVIRIDTAMLLEEKTREAQHSLSSYTHTHPLKSSQYKLTARNREGKSKTIFFFIFKEEQI